VHGGIEQGGNNYASDRSCTRHSPANLRSCSCKARWANLVVRPPVNLMARSAVGYLLSWMPSGARSKNSLTR